MMGDISSLTVQIGDDCLLVKVRGRDAWALAELIKAGSTGLTTLERPAPSWSQYAYAATHARYVLRSPVEVVEQEVVSNG